MRLLLNPETHRFFPTCHGRFSKFYFSLSDKMSECRFEYISYRRSERISDVISERMSRMITCQNMYPKDYQMFLVRWNLTSRYVKEKMSDKTPFIKWQNVQLWPFTKCRWCLKWGYTFYDHIRSINEVISVMVFRAITVCRLSEGLDRMWECQRVGSNVNGPNLCQIFGSTNWLDTK